MSHEEFYLIDYHDVKYFLFTPASIFMWSIDDVFWELAVESYFW